MATPREDWEFIKKEFEILRKFLKKYFKERSEDSDFERMVGLLEFGPFNWAKLAIAIIVTIICIFAFHLYRSWVAIWAILFIFIACYDFLFDKNWVVPIIKELFDFFMQIPVIIFKTIVAIVMSIKDAVIAMFKSKEG